MKNVQFSFLSSDVERQKLVDIPAADQVPSPYWCNFLFWLTASGCSILFAAVGALVSYYNRVNGPAFYVLLNSVFYFSGLPCSLVQARVDSYFDTKFGSKSAFLYRGVFFFVGLILSGLSLLCSNGYMTLVAFGFAGIFSWLSFGNLTSLVSIFPKSSYGFLHMGHRSSDFIMLAFFQIIQVEGYNVEEIHKLYYFCVGYLFLCLLGWIFLIHDPIAIALFSALDESRKPREEVAYDDNAPATTMSPRFRILDPHTHKPSGHDVLKNLTSEEIFSIYYYSLMVCQFSSNLAGFFISYVRPVGKFDIGLALYFLGKSADLLSRGVIHLYLPIWLRSPQTVRIVVGLRLSLLFIFFAYIFFPTFPQNNLFIIALITIFDGTRGYLTVVCYTEGCLMYHLKHEQSNAARKLNISFQSANMLTVVAAETILLLQQ